MKYPQSELLDPKSKGEIIEQAADLVVNSVNLLVTAIVLYIVYDIYESEKAEKEEKQKVQNRETILKLNGTLYKPNSFLETIPTLELFE